MSHSSKRRFFLGFLFLFFVLIGISFLKVSAQTNPAISTNQDALEKFFSSEDFKNLTPEEQKNITEKLKKTEGEVTSFVLPSDQTATHSPAPALSIEPTIQATSTEDLSLLFKNSQQPGTVNCFDYYTFNSVQASVQLENKVVFPGTRATFSGFLENKNLYPLVKGSVYVKIYRKETNSEKARLNGHHQIDSFFCCQRF